MVALAAVIGGVSGATGTFLSAQAPRVPTGPVMVLVATGLFIVSALFAPHRGVLARSLRQRANVLRERRHHLLRALIELEERAGKAGPFSTQELMDELGWERRRVKREAERLRRLDMVTLAHHGVEVTPAGLAEGTFVVKCHRLWEHYLVYRDILAADHVDRPADEVEHLLTPDILERLEEILRRDHDIDTDRVVDIHGSGSGYRPAGRERGEEVVG
jgi:manganese/zinc/iron transport system permease protein